MVLVAKLLPETIDGRPVLGACRSMKWRQSLLDMFASCLHSRFSCFAYVMKLDNYQNQELKLMSPSLVSEGRRQSKINLSQH